MHSCIHLTLVSYDHKSSKRLDLISIWSFDEFSSLCLRFLTIKPISHLTMVCYHQNPIKRTLGLTIWNSLNFMAQKSKFLFQIVSFLKQSMSFHYLLLNWKTFLNVQNVFSMTEKTRNIINVNNNKFEMRIKNIVYYIFLNSEEVYFSPKCITFHL